MLLKLTVLAFSLPIFSRVGAILIRSSGEVDLDDLLQIFYDQIQICLSLLTKADESVFPCRSCKNHQSILAHQMLSVWAVAPRSKIIQIWFENFAKIDHCDDSIFIHLAATLLIWQNNTVLRMWSLFMQMVPQYVNEHPVNFVGSFESPCTYPTSPICKNHLDYHPGGWQVF